MGANTHAGGLSHPGGLGRGGLCHEVYVCVGKLKVSSYFPVILVVVAKVMFCIY